ncbi:MAG: DUF3105 domain-containing protein [Acidobacteria bacterium]|nr:DUF3105 domain-containing protein [Acidobacteriota bacterium]
MARERARARREQAAQTRTEHKKALRRRTLIRRAALGALLTVVATSIGFCTFREHQLSSALTTATYPGGQHLAGRITYRERPPLGGTHNVVWQNCGTYDVPIHDEHAVHALEHGAVWITYRPDLPADDVLRLKTIAADDYMLLSPYPGLEAPVVASAWNHQIVLEGAGDSRLPQFIARFKNNPSSTPEFGAPCTGGTFATAEADSLQTAGGMVR